MIFYITFNFGQRGLRGISTEFLRRLLDICDLLLKGVVLNLLVRNMKCIQNIALRFFRRCFRFVDFRDTIEITTFVLKVCQIINLLFKKKVFILFSGSLFALILLLSKDGFTFLCVFLSSVCL